MKRTFKSVIAIALAVGVVAVASSVASAGADKPRPFRVSLESDFSAQLDDTCESGALQLITGTGIATHLGKFSISGQGCFGEPTTVTWTAANGDEITIVNTAEVGEVGVDGSAPITFITSDVTGTGRFENVSFPGDEQLTGKVWFFDELGASGHIEAGLDGTILFDASDRRN